MTQRIETLHCFDCDEGMLTQVRADFSVKLPGGDCLIIPRLKILRCNMCGEETLPPPSSRAVEGAIEEFQETVSREMVKTMGAVNGYAWQDSDGTIDIDTISDTKENVRIKHLETCMGWRFKYPHRYNQDDEWKRLLTYGSIVPVSVVTQVDTGAMFSP